MARLAISGQSSQGKNLFKRTGALLFAATDTRSALLDYQIPSDGQPLGQSDDEPLTDDRGSSNCCCFPCKFVPPDNIQALELDVSPSYCDVLGDVRESVPSRTLTALSPALPSTRARQLMVADCFL